MLCCVRSSFSVIFVRLCIHVGPSLVWDEMIVRLGVSHPGDAHFCWRPFALLTTHALREFPFAIANIEPGEYTVDLVHCIFQIESYVGWLYPQYTFLCRPNRPCRDSFLWPWHVRRYAERLGLLVLTNHVRSGCWSHVWDGRCWFLHLHFRYFNEHISLFIRNWLLPQHI
jgi:hypothetical protein